MKTPVPERSRLVGKKLFEWSRILVPLDFSDRSRQALDYAMCLAELHGAKIVLIHVAQAVLGPTHLSYEAIDTKRLLTIAKTQLEEVASQSVPPALLGQCLVRAGVPWEQIVAVARTMKLDLIVLSTHGHTGLKRALIGSTAERVVRHATCPVLTVRRR